MRKYLISLLALSLFFFTIACQVKPQPEPPVKEDKGVTEEMKTQPYLLSFDVDGQSYTYSNSKPFLDYHVSADLSNIMQNWWYSKFGEYNGPLFTTSGYETRKILTIKRLCNKSQDRFASFYLEYDNNTKKWRMVLDIIGEKEFIMGYNGAVEDSDIDIKIFDDDIYMKISRPLKGTRKVGSGEDLVYFSNISIKAKIISNKSSSQLDYLWVEKAQGNVPYIDGISTVQDFKISFIKIGQLKGSDLKGFLEKSDPRVSDIKMDTTINYFYQNGQKVFGSWNAEGTVFTYKPATPYKSNSRVDMVIPFEMVDIEGNNLYIPYHFSFKTGNSTMGTPNLDIPYNGRYINSVDLIWKQADSYNVDSYILERGDSQSGPFTTIYTLTSGDNDLSKVEFRYNDTNVVSGKSYYYRVTATANMGTISSKVVEGHSK